MNNGLSVMGVLAACQGMLFAAEINLDLDKSQAVEIGNCKITVMGAYIWRDWQPIVANPGPDGGSPLRAKVRVSIENPGTDAIKLSYRAVILDEKGTSHPATFKTLPNFRVIPEAIELTYRNLDDKAKAEVIAKYNVEWDGSLKPGETRLVEIITRDGPYVPVGSRVRVEMTWTDAKDHSVVVRTGETGVERTD